MKRRLAFYVVVFFTCAVCNGNNGGKVDVESLEDCIDIFVFLPTTLFASLLINVLSIDLTEICCNREKFCSCSRSTFSLFLLKVA